MEEILQNEWIAKYLAPFTHADHWEIHLNSLQSYANSLAGNLTTNLQNYDYQALTAVPLDTNPIVRTLALGNAFPYILAFHAFQVAVSLRAPLKNEHWLFAFLINTLATFTGGTVASWLALRLPFWLTSNTVIPMVFFIWLIVRNSPRDIVFKFLTSRPWKYILSAGAVVSKGRAIMAGVELAMEVAPGSVVAALFFGTLSGFGGVLTFGWIRKNNVDPTYLSEFSRPTWAIQSAFFSALAYYVAIDPSNYFFGPLSSIVFIRFVIIAYLVLHNFAAEMFGNFTPFPVKQVESVFLYTTGLGPKKVVVAKPSGPSFITKQDLNNIAKKEKEFQASNEEKSSKKKNKGKKDL